LILKGKSTLAPFELFQAPLTIPFTKLSDQENISGDQKHLAHEWMKCLIISPINFTAKQEQHEPTNVCIRHQLALQQTWPRDKEQKGIV
jgi:hypothetical protein